MISQNLSTAWHTRPFCARCLSRPYADDDLKLTKLRYYAAISTVQCLYIYSITHLAGHKAEEDMMGQLVGILLCPQ